MPEMTKKERELLIEEVTERYDSCISDLETLGYYNDADLLTDLRSRLLLRLAVVSNEHR